MAHAIILFVGARELMLLDDTVEVIVATGNADKSCLAMFAHDLPVQIEIWGGVLLESAFLNQPAKILFSLRIDFGRVNVCGCWQIDLGLADVQETQWVAGCD